MKHFKFPARAFIGWIRLCRPGSIHGPQNIYLNVINFDIKCLIFLLILKYIIFNYKRKNNHGFSEWIQVQDKEHFQSVKQDPLLLVLNEHLISQTFKILLSFLLKIDQILQLNNHNSYQTFNIQEKSNKNSLNQVNLVLNLNRIESK